MTPGFVPAPSWRNLLLSALVGVAVLFGFGRSAQAVGFADTASMGTARQSHTATLLDDGSVLVTGGYDGTSFLASAELYNPDGTFTPVTATMHSARRDHTATRLADGRVLIAGGLTSGSIVTNTAEIYDPVTKSFTLTGSMNNGSGTTLGRVSHTATLLSNGKVLITGGRRGTISSTALITAEIYDPGSGLFTRTVDMKAFRASQTATLLSDNRVLIAGGFINSGTSPINATATAEIFAADGLSSTATATSMATARGYHAAVLLQDNTVLITGGSSFSTFGNNNSVSLQSAEIFDPASGVFSSAGNMASPHSSHSATLLGSGRVLIAGSIDRTNSTGITSGDAELYLPDSTPGNRFGADVPMVTSRANYHAVLLPNGTVLLAGGASPDSRASTAAAVIYNPLDIEVTPVAHTFSDRAVGSTSLPQSFTITNDAGYPVTLDSIQISGAESAMFSLTNNCPATIPVDGNCSVSVTFTPASVGIKSASLDISYDNGIQFQLWPVALKGTGTTPPPPTTSALTVSFAGSGTGSVTSSSTPAPVLPLQEISCTGGAGTPCQGQFINGTTVTLSAAGGGNSQFVAWTGACTGTGTCQVTMDAAKSVSATFNTIPLLPTISGTPATSVTVGSSYSFIPTATNTTSFSIVNQPPLWSTFNPSTGALSGTPTGADVGTYTGIVITAHNANGSVSLPAFDLTVQPIPAVMVPGIPPVYFTTIQNAYLTVGSDSTIAAQAVTFTENLLFNRPISFKLEGGKDSSFQDSGAFTTIQGTLDVSQGAADLSKINFQ